MLKEYGWDDDEPVTDFMNDAYDFKEVFYEVEGWLPFWWETRENLVRAKFNEYREDLYSQFREFSALQRRELMGKELAKFGKKWSDEQTHIKAIMVGIEKGLIKKIKEEMEEMKVKRIYEGERIKIIEGKKKEMERLEKNAMKVLTTKKKVAMRCETCGSINCDGTKVGDLTTVVEECIEEEDTGVGKTTRINN